MAIRDIIAVGGSAGSVEGLTVIAAGLPRDLPAAVFVVLHVSPDHESLLPELLSRAGPVPAHHAVQGEAIRIGHIYVAPPDYHMLVEDSTVRVFRGPRENWHRPSIDATFRSAAIFGPRVIGVLLSGADEDGAQGLLEIQRAGGVAVVQDPLTSLFPQMPRSALHHMPVDYKLPVAEIGPLLSAIAGQPCETAVGNSDPLKPGDTAREEDMATDPELGVPSAFTCPECGGALWELKDGDLVRYRCRIGHIFSDHALVASDAETVERALWSAVRALEESAAVARRMAGYTGWTSPDVRERFLGRAESRERDAAIIRSLAEHGFNR